MTRTQEEEEEKEEEKEDGPVHIGDKVKTMFDILATFWQLTSPAFDKVDRVEQVQLWPRQAVEFNFFASVYRP